MIDRLSLFITRHPKAILIICIILLVPSAIGFFATGVNYDILSYLPEELNSVEALEILDKNFQFAASSILIVDDTDVRNIAGLKEKIEKVEGVSKVLWTNSIIDERIPADILPDVVNSVFYSGDGSCTMMIIQYSTGSSSEQTLDAVDKIRSIAQKNCYVSGLSAVTADIREICNTEAPLYIAVAILLALVALEFTLNAVALPLVVLVVLGFAVVYNMGSNLIFGNISFITECIAAVLQLGVTMDYSVFLIDRFDEERKRTSDLKLAMARTISHTFVSLISSSLTTVFGFIALCFMSFSLGFDIGIVMAKGVIFGIVTVIVLLPSIILIFYSGIYKHSHKSYVPSFRRLNLFTVKHRKVLTAVFVLMFIPAYFASTKVDMYYNIVEALPTSLQSISSLQKMKDDFNMATSHFVLVDSSLPEKDVEKMQQEIEKLDGITYAVSLYSFIGSAINTDILPDAVLDICEKDGYGLMLINTSFDPGTDEENLQIGNIEKIISEYSDKSYLTGEGVLTRDLIKVTDDDFMVTNIISIVAVFLLIAISFKSISIPFILVGSIELAIFLNEAMCLITGSRVPFIAPTVIGCVQLGATVDYAILLTGRFREEISKGVERHKAIEKAADSSMRSIFQSALVFFVATIGVYFVCDIALVKSLCLLLARGAVVSFFVIMLVLAPVLCLTNNFIEKTTIGWRKKSSSLAENEEEHPVCEDDAAQSVNDSPWWTPYAGQGSYISKNIKNEPEPDNGQYRSPAAVQHRQEYTENSLPERRGTGENNPLLRSDVAKGLYKPPENRMQGEADDISLNSCRSRKTAKNEREERLSGSYFSREENR